MWSAGFICLGEDFSSLKRSEMHFSLVPDSNYCVQRDLEDRNSSCFGEGIMSGERATDFTKTKMMFGDTLFHLLQDLSWQEAAAIWSRHPYGVGEGVYLPMSRALLAPSVLESVLCAWVRQARIKTDTMQAFNQPVLLANCASWVLIVPAQGDSHFVSIVCGIWGPVKYFLHTKTPVKGTLYYSKTRKVIYI